MEKTQKNEFVEIEFTGSANQEVFDTTSKEKAKEMNLDADVKPITVSIGNGMVIKGFDNELEGKELGKQYSVHLTADQGFGKRDPRLIRTLPLKIFHQQNMNPVPGTTVQLDNHIAKIISVSGGRVTTDFNNPLAGKEIDYEFKILRKVTDDKEKVNAVQDFFFKQRFEFEIKDKTVIFKDEKIKPLVEMFKQKFKEISGFDAEIEVKKEEKKEEKPKTETSSEKKEEETKSENKSK